MKRTALVLIGLAISVAAGAQSFEKGTKVLQFGVGLASTYYGNGYNTVLPPLSASFEVGVTEKLGIGYIGVGPYVGFFTSRFKNANVKFNSTAVVVGGRAAYHFDINHDKWDLYAGLMLGYVIVSDDSNQGNFSGVTASGFGFSGHFGARYYFTNNIGMFAELGYGISVLNLGVSLKF